MADRPSPYRGCPFCGSTDVTLDGMRGAVRCRQCFAIGPAVAPGRHLLSFATYEATLRRAWNQRAEVDLGR